MKKISVEVAYADTQKQKIMFVVVDEGATIAQAIQVSGILQQVPDIDLTKNKVGIFGKLKELTTHVQEGDRIEIYRPLKIEPKEARKAKVKKQAMLRNKK